MIGPTSTFKPTDCIHLRSSAARPSGATLSLARAGTDATDRTRRQRHPRPKGDSWKVHTFPPFATSIALTIGKNEVLSTLSCDRGDEKPAAAPDLAAPKQPFSHGYALILWLDCKCRERFSCAICSRCARADWASSEGVRDDDDAGVCQCVEVPSGVWTYRAVGEPKLRSKKRAWGL